MFIVGHPRRSDDASGAITSDLILGQRFHLAGGQIRTEEAEAAESNRGDKVNTRSASEQRINRRPCITAPCRTATHVRTAH